MALRAKKTRRDSEIKQEVIEAATKEDTTRLNAEIPISLHRQVKIMAARKGNSITELTIEALREYLSKHSNE